MNMYDFVLRGSDHPNAVAVIDEHDRQWSYAQLDTKAAHLSGYLEHTTRAQDRCLIYADNGLFWLCAYLSCLRCGRIAVPVAPDCTDATLRHILQNASPGVAFVDGPRLQRLVKYADKSVSVVCEEESDSSEAVCWDEAASLVPSDKPAAMAEETIATILYTGGNTDDPRGVILSHGNLGAACLALSERLALSDMGRTLTAISLADAFGITIALSALRVGGSIALDNLPLEPQRALGRMTSFNCTGIASTSAIFQALLNHSGFSGSAIPFIRYIEHVGGKAPLGLIAKLQHAFPKASIHAMYGMAEAGGALTSVPPELAITKCSSAGEPLPRVSIRVLDEYGHALPVGMTGQIVVESPCVAVGYWNDPERSRQTFRNGRLHTGDLGMLDGDGALQVVGRAEDFLSLGGVSVTTAQIEQAISLFPGMRENAVLSRHDDLLADSVVLVAVHPRGEEVRQQLLDFCAKQLPFNQRPRSVLFRSRLPRDISGQVDRRALQEQMQLEQHALPPAAHTLQAQQDPLLA